MLSPNAEFSLDAVAPPDRESASDSSTGRDRDGNGPAPAILHIFVNRLKYGAAQGVRPTMTGSEIAALAHVPAELAVIRRGAGQNAVPVGVDEVLAIKQAEHFMVTRKVVEGGHAD